MDKLKVVILRNENSDDHILWVKACEDYREQVKYAIVDLTKQDWFEEIQKHKPGILLAKPGGLTSSFKQLYDERIYILKKKGYHIFPSPEEIFIYENKRFLSYWLKSNGIPHPATYVFYYYDEAHDFVKNCKFPIVAKTNIGASGSGVYILKTKQEAQAYIQDTFNGRGAKKRVGPNLNKGGLFRRGMHYIQHPTDIKKKLSVYAARKDDPQTEFIILQEFIPHDYEWRVVRIGDSFFAHKKINKEGKASGLLLKGYEDPSTSLLDFVKEITDRFKFYSQAVDVFEMGNSRFLVNEMQCIFGQSDPYQMLINDKPGRYIFLKGEWAFEEGDFARNACFNLRLEYLLSKFNTKKI